MRNKVIVSMCWATAVRAVVFSDSVLAMANSVPEERSFQGVIVATDPAWHTMRVPVTPEILKRHNRLLTQDQKRAYVLDVNGEHWAVLRTLGRTIGREEAGTAADLAIGLGCKELVYREEAGANRLVSVTQQSAYSHEKQLPPGKHRLTINTESWSRIVGLTKAELELALKE